jgi:hypothetical protein
MVSRAMAMKSRLIFCRQIYKARSEGLQELKKDSSDFFFFLCFEDFFAVT